MVHDKTHARQHTEHSGFYPTILLQLFFDVTVG